MLLNDSFENLRCAGSIPDSFRVNHRNRAIQAEPQAIGLGSGNAPGAAEAQFIQSAFEVVPSGETLVFSATLGFGLVGTNEDMPLDLVDVKRSCNLAEFHIG